MSIKRGEFYKELAKFLTSNNTTVTLDKSHIHVILENKSEAIKASIRKDEVIEKLLLTQQGDQELVRELDQKVKELEYKLQYVTMSRDNAVAEALRPKKNKSYKIPTIDGYDNKGNAC